jgi:hypothetical protein
MAPKWLPAAPFGQPELLDFRISYVKLCPSTTPIPEGVEMSTQKFNSRTRLKIDGLLPRAETFTSSPAVVCRICGKAVPIETANTDAEGKAVHEACYVGLAEQSR